MPGLLSRSKSMRLLKTRRKDITYQDQAISLVSPPADLQTHVGTSRSTTPDSRLEANLETARMPARPSTSGGPGDRRTQFHLKTSPAPPMGSTNDFTFVPSMSTTALSTTDTTNSREGIIGIALGSPTIGSHWNPTSEATTIDSSTPNTSMASKEVATNAGSHQIGEKPRPKLSRWKSLFKKNSPSPLAEKPSFYQLAQTVNATRGQRADSHHDDDEFLSPLPGSNFNGDRGRMPSPPTFKSEIRASRRYGTEDEIVSQSLEPNLSRARGFTAGSLPVNPRMSLARSATTPIPASKSASIQQPLIPQVVVSRSAQEATGAAGTSFLDVHIPDVTLERYSIMFSDLLQPGQVSSSSLLARRQGNADKLKPLHAISTKEEKERPQDYRIQRRATSPTFPSPSPRLSLFPSTNNSRRSSSVPRGKVYRPKPGPEKSPLQQTMKRIEVDDEIRNSVVPKATQATTPSLSPSVSIDLDTSAITPNSIQSFESEDESITLVVGRTGPAHKIYVDEQEPEWEICNKTSAGTPASGTTPLLVTRAASLRQPKVTKFSALSSNPASAPLDTPSPLQRISSMRSPSSTRNMALTNEEQAAGRAMVGVARSVSVSRANSPRAFVKSPIDLASPERFVDKQALTPTMVEVKNRRSQRVQLVDA